VPFGAAALEQFLTIEKPAAADAPPESDSYETIGQFYAAIERGIRTLCDTLGEDVVFCGDPGRQLNEMHFSGGGGEIIPVHDLKSALSALAEIVEQGEGAARTEVWDGDKDIYHPDRDEVAHYYRFVELAEGRRFRPGDTPQSGPSGEPIRIDPEGILPMRPNQRTADYAQGSAIRTAQEEFNNTYCLLLYLLEGAFNGSPSQMRDAIGAMYALKSQAQALMKMPSGDGMTTAGPTFEYVPPEQRD
jgi:ketosteroid isomerase-like protein